MSERPILFSAPMVRALLAGTKTQTRRALAPDLFISSGGAVVRMVSVGPATTGIAEAHCPYWREPGDTLWVREAHAFSAVDPEGLSWHDDPENWDAIYRADPNQPAGGWRDSDGKVIPPPWRPSIHMPRWASRITLEVTGVRVERLQDISPDDAEAEGLKAITKDGRLIKYGIPDADGLPGTDDSGWPWSEWRISPVDAYRKLWESINGPGSWDANPWVWVLEFRRVTGSMPGDGRKG